MMMCLQHYIVALMALILVFSEKGAALHCWKCSSQLDATCRDLFNTTKILMNQRRMDSYNYANVQQPSTYPQLIECQGMHTSTISQTKNVCLKIVQQVPNGPDKVSRECRMVNMHLETGACPDDMDIRNRAMSYCGTCDYDGCNSASTNSLVFAAILPAVLLILAI